MNYVAQTERENQFLSLLPEPEYKQLLPELERVRMEIGNPVHEADEPIPYVYFPITCIISQVTELRDGFTVEAGVIGREGCSGVDFALCRNTSPRPTHIQLAGDSLRMKADRFQAALDESSVFDKLMRRFTSAYLSQVAQVIACNSHHRVEERLARWMLMCHDRAEGNELRITQEFIAQMLGVHRPGVSIAIVALRDAGLISNQRGVIIIKDRAGLEEATCECYEEINREYERYLNTSK
ncbi:MAG: Crp/Fnr family transcriptional regulator [Acidobacteriota bacterium]|nr:Crp/Fnr family transcriptional regulator [Acidobacteriota bacterium]